MDLSTWCGFLFLVSAVTLAVAMCARAKRKTEDDGHVWAVCAEPSPFRVAESTLNGPFTRGEARRFVRRYLRGHPFGLCEVSRLSIGATWPPRTTWDKRKASEAVAK